MIKTDIIRVPLLNASSTPWQVAVVCLCCLCDVDHPPCFSVVFNVVSTAMPHEPSPSVRINLASIKHKLNHVLQNNSDAYWNYMRRYIQAKLAKKELDGMVTQLLGAQNSMYLYSYYINYIIKSVYCYFFCLCYLSLSKEEIYIYYYL